MLYRTKFFFVYKTKVCLLFYSSNGKYNILYLVIKEHEKNVPIQGIRLLELK
ncbi:hypothetical protein DES36_11419 [Alkalibaculum bacchi]|uniref:Uncharacterized protein n=1 Tax=Alkalibaculum bacchi TaxID=645887 RepID=A0A366I4H8_9FIRM|nr:hypothetical protein DES36_11419 [Alkalibaculum bacchi]